jgi:polygalacturonase
LPQRHPARSFDAGLRSLRRSGDGRRQPDNLRINTNRDGINIDCCHNVRITNCSVNAPWDDDAVCPKSSFALGYARATENVTIANCYVTGGYQVGALLDGGLRPSPEV